MMSKEALTGHQRFDSRGKPTVQARLSLKDGDRIITVQTLVPSGASTGSKEAKEVRDGGKAYQGLGVSRAIENIGEIADSLDGTSIFDQEKIDKKMIALDGTDNKGHLGANAILAVSLAVARTAAEYRSLPLLQYLSQMYGEPNPTLLPTPMMNLINGGAHARNGLPFQEFMIVPTGAESFDHAMQMGTEIYIVLGQQIEAAGVGDEGGYSPIFDPRLNGRDRVRKSLQMLTDAIKEAGYKAGNDETSDIGIALDVAASEFYNEQGNYNLGINLGIEENLDFGGMIDFYKGLVDEFPIISIEDGMSEVDSDGWNALTNSFAGQKGIQIVGDDLFVTNPAIFREGINNGIANAVLVKPNQIGTLTETLKVIRMAQQNGYNPIISHRSGETEDTFIADLAVATRAGQIKTGAPARSERTAKYNRLLDIEEIELPALGLTPEYAGFQPFKR